MKRQILAAILAASVLMGGLSHAANNLSGKVNLNTATAAELTLLPGVGESRAQAIIAQRKAKPFAKKEELLLIKGIGDALFAKMQPYIAVEGPNSLVETVGDQTKP